ncbi:RecX family transcriptional regulator [Sphingomonas quercus]|uniref:Regulatory protein RecX n=1 Tax=Sphingomonas quercus TaxID=2842451 RepID=A0ABS6BNG9_9SPHN|nr:RecX family transcriptional regulator [Sphingomonas quercus]MBU3078936.1 RecX family transcriptional regulator [Sphingomonas quercus]
MSRQAQGDRRQRPIDAPALEALALAYAARYATTRAKLAAYLSRKLTVRQWVGTGSPPVEDIVARMAEAGYVDDRAFAEARGRSLARRGYGRRRVAAALAADGIAAEDRQGALPDDEEGARAAALAFARRRRIGPYAAEPATGDVRARAIAAMIRAGHEPELARAIISAPPGDNDAD